MKAGAALLLVVSIAGCHRSPLEPATTRPGTIRAITCSDWTRDGYASPAAAEALRSLAATGANTVVFIVTAYQSNAAASSLRIDAAKTPSETALRAAIATARAAGLAVILKPHVDVDDGTWRGRIDPADATAWFASYADFVLPWARLAAEVGSPWFVAGTELGSTLDHAAAWRDFLSRVRDVFPERLAYAASWDESERVPFWDAVDLVGIDAYFPVASRDDAGRLEIYAGWQPWIERLAVLQSRVGRPLLLTEVGYRSIDGAARRPADSILHAALDLQEQADLYWAALQATARPWIAGACFWDWPANAAWGPQDTSYTPRGKPAEGVLRAAWSAR